MNHISHASQLAPQLASPPALMIPAQSELHAESPALQVLTDFARVKPRTIHADVSVDDAHLTMRYGGVRLLLVVDTQQRCIGALAAQEVIGGRRITVAMQQRGVSRDEVTAEMIMTPWHKLTVMPVERLAGLTIEGLLRSLPSSMTDQHLLVIEQDEAQGQRIRGLVSAADIRRAIGEGPVSVPQAHSFADICRVLTGHDL